MSVSLATPVPMTTAGRDTTVGDALPSAVRLWIDGVGSWQLWLPEKLTIGGPPQLGASSPAADLALLADLSRMHATIERQIEDYRLTLHGTGLLRGAKPTSEALLRTGDEVTLGRDVRLQFELPSMLSPSARLTLLSGHRPATRIDGVVLMEQACLIGPQTDQHIVCPRAKSNFVLFRKGDGLWCRSREEWRLEGRPVAGAAMLSHGAVVSTESLSFRVEWR
jgi:hypothetical protein